MVWILEPKIFASLKKGVTSSFALFPFRISNSSTFSDAHHKEEGDLGPIKTIDNVLPSLNCT